MKTVALFLLLSAPALADLAACKSAFWANAFERAINECTPLAERGNSEAQFNLAVMYALGQGVQKNYTEAMRLFRLAADQGNASAEFNLGVIYDHGDGVPQDYAEAVRWYRLAAEKGNASAQTNLGTKYYNGQGVPQDYKEALRWYRFAADQGIVLAQMKLGIMYEKGEGITQNYVLAHMWYNLGTAGSSGDQQKTNSGIRDYIATMMTPAQIAEAQRLAREWKPTAGR